MTTQSSLTSFISTLGGESSLKVEQDFGSGYVKLRTSEAERRQAAQDIKSSEDIVLELLRNSRDADARTIYIAISADDANRSITVIDDGSGIPEWMHEKVFESRVTSKLDSAHQDKWGFHGRGMALYSIRQNALMSKVLESAPQRGCSIIVKTDKKRLPEKKDQSTFPRFVEENGVQSMRGPKNILRTIAEFAIEHRDDTTIICGSPAEIASALYEHSIRNMPAYTRIFGSDSEDADITVSLGRCHDPKGFADKATKMGLDISERTARRILDSCIDPAIDMLERIRRQSFGEADSTVDEHNDSQHVARTSLERPHKVSFSKDDLDDFSSRIESAYSELAEKYYLKGSKPTISRRGGVLKIELEIADQDV